MSDLLHGNSEEFDYSGLQTLCLNCAQLGHSRCTETVPCFNSIFQNMLPVSNAESPQYPASRAETGNFADGNLAELQDDDDIPSRTTTRSGQALVPDDFISTTPSIHTSGTQSFSASAFNPGRATLAHVNIALDVADPPNTTSPYIHGQDGGTSMNNAQESFPDLDIFGITLEARNVVGRTVRTATLDITMHGAVNDGLEDRLESQDYIPANLEGTSVTPGTDYFASDGPIPAQQTTPASDATRSSPASDLSLLAPTFESQFPMATPPVMSGPRLDHPTLFGVSRIGQYSNSNGTNFVNVPHLNNIYGQDSQRDQVSLHRLENVPSTFNIPSSVTSAPYVMDYPERIPCLVIGSVREEQIEVQVRMIIESTAGRDIALVNESNPDHDGVHNLSQPSGILALPGIQFPHIPQNICHSHLSRSLMGQAPNFPESTLAEIQAYCSTLCGSAALLLPRRAIASFSFRRRSTNTLHLAYCFAGWVANSNNPTAYMLRISEVARAAIRARYPGIMGERGMAEARDTFFLKVHENNLRQQPTANEGYDSLTSWQRSNSLL